MYLNYCGHKKVIKCSKFNPFEKNTIFLSGFKNTNLSKYVSLYRNNGSIISRFVWRFLLEKRLIDTFLDPYVVKPAIKNIFEQLFVNIKNNKTSSLFFSHILAPHTPYGFTESCLYDGNKSVDTKNWSINEKKIQHNLEKYCMITYLDELFENLKKISEFNNLEIIIFSDHDSRIDKFDPENNVIFVHKNKNSKRSNIFNEKISINELFKNLTLN